MNFDAHAIEFELVDRIIDRYVSTQPGDTNRGKLAMDLIAVHLNSQPIDLLGLFEARIADLIHDVSGISRYLDRRTGCLTQCFLPRYSKSSRESYRDLTND